MGWPQLLKQLVGATEVRNRRVASLRTAGSTVAELGGTGPRGRRPGPPLRRILAGMKNPCAAVVLLGVAVGQRFTADSALGPGVAAGLALVIVAGVGASELALVFAEVGRRGIDAEYGTARRFHLANLCGGLLLMVAMVLLSTLPGVTYLAEVAFHGSFDAVSLAQVCGLIVVWCVRAHGKDEPMPVVAQPTISPKA